MPDPNYPSSFTALSNQLVTVGNHGVLAMTELGAWNNAPEPRDIEDPCAALAELKAQVNSLLAAITSVESQLGCNVI